MPSSAPTCSRDVWHSSVAGSKKQLSGRPLLVAQNSSASVNSGSSGGNTDKSADLNWDTQAKREEAGGIAASKALGFPVSNGPKSPAGRAVNTPAPKKR